MNIKSLFYGNHNSVNLALIDLFDYSIKSDRAVQHLKAIYYMKTNKCMVDCKLSNSVAMTEITQSLMNQSAYLISSLIDNMMVVYGRYFLDKITFEADLDESGIIYESIRVSCAIKTNLPEYHVDGWQILKSVLNATIEAERSEILECPVTELILNLQRRKLRNFSLVFDFKNITNGENIYKKAISQSVLAAFEVLIKKYCTYKSSHEASVILKFDLKNRRQFCILEGTIFPTKKLTTYKGHFLPNEIKYIIIQLNQILSLIQDASLSDVTLTRHPNGIYLTSFRIVNNRNEYKRKLELDLSTSYSLSDTFNNLIKQYTFTSLYADWINKINALIFLNDSGLTTKLKDYQLIHKFEKPTPLMESREILLAADSTISNGGSYISNLKLTCKQLKVNEVLLDITDGELENNASKAMQDYFLSNINISNQNIETIYNFINTESGYYLRSEKYLGWASA